MRIEVGRISDNPIELSEDIEASNWDLDSFDVKFIKKITINCCFRRLGPEVLVTGKIITRRNIICSRCLGNKEQEADFDFVLSYAVSSLGDYLDIDEDAREELLLTFPMKVLCKPDCKGICPGCKVNLNLAQCKCQMRT